MRLRLLTLLLASVLSPAFAQCEAILQTGIFDAFNVLDDASRYTLVAGVARAETATVTPIPGLEGVLSALALAEAFDRPYAEVRANERVWSQVLTASEMISSNWLACVRVNPAGLSHFITPLDAETFMYRVSYTPNTSFSSTDIAGFGLSGASCDHDLAAGTVIHQSGVSLLCKRDTPDSRVAITLSAVLGTANVEPILLNPISRGAATPLPSQPILSRQSDPTTTKVCLRHSQFGIAGLLDSGWQCSSGAESAPIFLGDDTGYRNQSLSIRAIGDTEVCFRHIKEGANGVEDSDWVCSVEGAPSPYVVLGDDSGFVNQQLSLRVTGPGTVCLRHRRAERDYRSCWSDGVFAEPIPLGNDKDSGEQLLWLEVQPN